MPSAATAAIVANALISRTTRMSRFPFFVGWRYVRARREARFVSVVSAVALGGLALGVTALIVVLSVMNGFDAELRGRILSLVPQIEVESKQGVIEHWEELAARLEQVEGVRMLSPAISGTAMLSTPGIVRGVQLSAIDPVNSPTAQTIARHLRDGELAALTAERFGIILGSIAARALGVRVGDRLTVILPEATITPAGVFPRMRRFDVVGVFAVGAQVDANTAYIHLADGARLYRTGQGVQQLRIRADNPNAALALSERLRNTLGDTFNVRDWSQTQGSLFAAVQMEKRMVSLLLLVIVAVAAFNIVSILTMVVAEKRSAIAVLRTMGASPPQITAIFTVQGLIIAGFGIFAGFLVGIPLALNVGAVTRWIEELFGFHIFNPGVYFISHIPSELHRADLIMIAGVAICLSITAALIPARRAAAIGPAEVLRYE